MPDICLTKYTDVACRDDLLPVTDVGVKHIASARYWPLGVEHPIQWEDTASWSKSSQASLFGSRLAVFSIPNHRGPTADLTHPTSSVANDPKLCNDILRLAGIHFSWQHFRKARQQHPAHLRLLKPHMRKQFGIRGSGNSTHEPTHSTAHV